MINQNKNVEFKIILHAGNAKSSAMLAIEKSRNFNFEEAEDLIFSSNEELIKAHQIEKGLIVNEANGGENEISILMIHAQDHLSGAMLTLEFAKEFLNIYKEIYLIRKEEDN